MVLASASCLVTLVAVLGGVGVLPEGEASAPAASLDNSPSNFDLAGGLAAGDDEKTDASTAADEADADESASKPDNKTVSSGAKAKKVTKPSKTARATAPPTDSGEGKRVVFSESDQRVWLIRDNDQVQRTYLVSGSVYDNLDPGTYSVYSRSEQAWGIDDSGTMQYFVRFTKGDNDAAIGFHDIPVLGGEPVQTAKELGTPLSHGCVRQKRADAVALWDFAPLGTTVVVV